MQANKDLKSANDNSTTKIRIRRWKKEMRLTKRVFFPVNVYFWKWFVSSFFWVITIGEYVCVCIQWQTSRLWNKWKWMSSSGQHNQHSTLNKTETHGVYTLNMTKLMAFSCGLFSIFQTIYWNIVCRKETKRK